MSTSTRSPRRPTTSTTPRPTTKRLGKTSPRPPQSTKPPKGKTSPRPPQSTKSPKGKTSPRPPQSTKSPKDKERKPEQKDDESDKMGAHQKIKSSARKRSKAKGTYPVSKAMEYKIDEMFPDMKLLLKKKKDWNFRDPDYIRAAYVESETGMMTQWKSENAKIKSVKNADIQFKSNLSNDLKMRHLLRKIEKERRERRHLRQILRNFQNPPQFPPVQIFTNATTQLRQSHIQNNPTVPAFVVQHFAKFKKPPFKTTKKEPHKVTRCG